jgi:hypothetical protein
MSQVIIVQTLRTKSLLTSLYKKEVEATLRGDSLRELPLFGKEGLGEIFGKTCFLNRERLWDLN